MSEQAAGQTGSGDTSTESPVERGGMDEASDAPLTETEIETSKKPEDRDSDV